MTLRESRRERQTSREERRRRLSERLTADRLNAVTWALVLVWGAVVIIMEIGNASWADGWNSGAVFAVGAGAVLLADGIIRALTPAYRRGMTFKLILGAVLLAAGIGEPLDFDGRYIGVAALITIAAVILLRAFTKPERTVPDEEKRD
jgi:hypothetical protein